MPANWSSTSSPPAEARAPLPFYLYIFSERSGYKVSVDAIKAIQERLDNFVGMKVTERDFEDVRPYFGLGLEIFIGSDPSLPAALAAGAAGSASGMASVYPGRVRELLDSPTKEGGEAIADLYREIQAEAPLIPGIKAELDRLGVPIKRDVRRPARPL